MINEEKAKEIIELVDTKRDKFAELNDAVWAVPELGFEEYKSSKLLVDVLKEEDFEVETGIDGIETAFIATYGHGKPIIGMLAEYDALPDLSQEAMRTEHKPVVENGNGHGCMHNTLGSACVAGGVAVKDYLKAHPEKSGTIRVYGCPGEEAGWSKMFLTRDGFFDDVDVAFSWHACHVTGVMSYGSNANICTYFRFHGKAAHAAGAPYLGRSALDACELMNVGVQYLREHIVPEARIHYAYVDAGGKSPNVVQPYAELKYYVRAPKMKTASEILDRVKDIAHGAAMMTGTTVDIEVSAGMSDFVPNDTISRLMTEAVTRVGIPDYDDDDRAFAKELYDQFTPAEKNFAKTRIALHYPGCSRDKFEGVPLIEEIAPYVPNNGVMAGSTDVGDVSYVTPTALCWISCLANGTPGHSWQVTTTGASPIAHKVLACAAKTMALSTVVLFDDPETIKVAREELIRTTGGKQICPVDKNTPPKKPF